MQKCNFRFICFLTFLSYFTICPYYIQQGSHFFTLNNFTFGSDFNANNTIRSKKSIFSVINDYHSQLFLWLGDAYNIKINYNGIEDISDFLKKQSLYTYNDKCIILIYILRLFTIKKSIFSNWNLRQI